jgi:hypothetical protein
MLILKREKYTMEKHPLDEYIQLKIEEFINQHESQITKKDAQIIIKSLMPFIDEMVSEKVKYHFKLLANHLLDTLKSTEEKLKDA